MIPDAGLDGAGEKQWILRIFQRKSQEDLLQDLVCGCN